MKEKKDNTINLFVATNLILFLIYCGLYAFYYYIFRKTEFDFWTEVYCEIEEKEIFELFDKHDYFISSLIWALLIITIYLKWQ